MKERLIVLIMALMVVLSGATVAEAKSKKKSKRTSRTTKVINASHFDGKWAFEHDFVRFPLIIRYDATTRTATARLEVFDDIFSLTGTANGNVLILKDSKLTLRCKLKSTQKMSVDGIIWAGEKMELDFYKEN